MTRGSRKRVLVVGAVAWMVFTGGAVAAAATINGERIDDASGALVEQNSPAPTLAVETSLSVDLSIPGAENALVEALGEHDGRTIRVEGIEVLPSDERRARDLALAGPDLAMERRASDPLCPPEPFGPRSDELTVHLWCDPSAGPTTRSVSSGSLSKDISEATAQILDRWIEIPRSEITVIENGDGKYEVDLSSNAGRQIANLGFAVGTEIITDINFTGYSHFGIDELTFTIDGDCVAFHVATGGDMCVPFTFDEVSELEILEGSQR